MTREELDLQLEQKLPSSISFEGYYGDFAPEGKPPCLGWNYWFIQGNLELNVFISGKVLSRLSSQSIDIMGRMVERTFEQKQMAM